MDILFISLREKSWETLPILRMYFEFLSMTVSWNCQKKFQERFSDFSSSVCVIRNNIHLWCFQDTIKPADGSIRNEIEFLKQSILKYEYLGSFNKFLKYFKSSENLPQRLWQYLVLLMCVNNYFLSGNQDKLLRKQGLMINICHPWSKMELHRHFRQTYQKFSAKCVVKPHEKKKLNLTE